MKILRPHQREAIDILNLSTRGIINLPTGTGKSLIQSRYIVEDIQKSNCIKVYVIVSPRILLSNQLLREVQSDLTVNGLDCLPLSVHSGQPQMFDDMLIYRDIKSTTKSAEIREQYERALREGVNLIISSTYDSLDRIQLSQIPVEAILCDEAHYLVTEEFEKYVREVIGNKVFFFTATLKDTASDNGLGMNNIERFGSVLYQKSPLEMIQAGEIVRPRMHFATTTVPVLTDDIIDAKAIVECFIEHRTVCNVGAKMLVTCKSSEHLNSIASHPEMARLKRIRPGLTMFDISSKHSPRINGEEVNREEFLSRLQTISSSDEAIILHIDILTEGIDVPGITGIMPLTNLKKSKFLQTLGRATRLQLQDRQRLYGEEILPNDLEEFIKPYAYIIIPSYGRMGEDIRAGISSMIHELRSYNFNPAEDVIIKPTAGAKIPISIDMLNQLDTNQQRIQEILNEIQHEIESNEEVQRTHEEVLNLNSLEDLSNLLYS